MKTKLHILVLYGVLLYGAFIVGSALWERGITPILGRLGIIEYTPPKSPAQARYERFLAEVSSCVPKKTVSVGAKSKIPAFQTFICENGEEKIWANKVEVIKKSENGQWVLEP